MANGKKNKFSIDLGFNVTDQPSLSESSSDLPDTTKLKFDFSRPIDRVDIGSITEEPEDVTWYPTRGIFEGIEQTTKGIIGGIKYIPTVTNSDSKYDQIKALEDFDKLIKSAPPQAQFDEEPIRATGQFIGRLLPSAAPIMGGIVAKSPKLIYSGIAGLTASSFGQGMIEYDQYKLSKGEDPYENNLERIGIGSFYAMSELVGEALLPVVGKLIPRSYKKLITRDIGQKIMKRSFFPNIDDDFIKYMNKNFYDFAKSSKANENVLRKVLTLKGSTIAGLEGAGEVITEVGQKFGDWWITNNKEAFDNSAGDFVSAFIGGALMGGGIGAVSFNAQNSMTKERRASQENLFFTEYDDQFQEIAQIEGKEDGSKEFTLMDAYGDITKVKDTDIKGEVINLSNEQFDAILKSKQDDINLQDEAFIYNNNFELEQQKVKLIDLGKFVNSQQKKGEDSDAIINIASINNEDVVITGRGDSDSNILFGFKLNDYTEGGTANVEVFRSDQIQNNEIKSINVSEATSNIEKTKQENVDIVESSSRPVIGQKFNMNGVEFKVVGTSPQEVNIQNDKGEVVPLNMIEYTALNKSTETTQTSDQDTSEVTISLDQIQFNEDGTIIPEIKPKDAVAETFEVGKKRFNVMSLNKETGSRELSETYKTEKTAQKYADLLNEEYGNQTFEIEDRTNKNDPLAKNNFVIVAKPKINDNQIKKIKAKAKEIQKKEKIFSKGADDVMKAIETNQGTEQAEVFKAEYDKLVDKTIQARQKKEKDQPTNVSKPRETRETKKQPKKTIKKVKTKSRETKPKRVIKKIQPKKSVKFSREFFDALPQLDEKRDKGMYFTRVVSPLNKNQVKKVETIINRIKGSWKNSPNTVVYQSLDDYRLDNGQANVDEYTNAFWDHNKNEIVFFADMLNSAGRVQEVFYHETVGHQGLRGILSEKELNKTLDSVYEKLDFKNKELQQRVFFYHFHSIDNSLKFDPSKNYLNEIKPNGFSLTQKDKRDIAEEHIAHASEKNINRKEVNSLINLFKSSIKKITGKKIDLLDKQVKEIIQSSKQYLKAGDIFIDKNSLKQASQNNYNIAGARDTKKASSSRVLESIKQSRELRRSQLASQVDTINESVEILEKNYKKGKTVNTSKGNGVASMKLIEDLLGKNNKADEQYLKLANILKDYNQIKGTYSDEITDINEAKKVFEEAKSDIKSNLLFIYNNIDPDIRNISKLWYDSANSVLAKKLSEEYGVTRDQASGVIAVMSPQKDWFRNVALADRVLKIVVGNKGYAFDQNMAKSLINAVDQKGNKIFLKNLKPTERKRKINGLVGKKITDLKGEDVGLFIRAFDNEYLPDKSYYNYSPTGDVIGKVKTKAGLDSKIAWGSTGEIGKAVSVIQNGSKENISNQLGDQHKVRSFYNNISDPKNKNSVTIDTHAIASAYLLPLAGKDGITLLGLGGAPASLVTGVKGTYGLIADAYREVANDLKILPRELQSIVWEGVRGFYSDTFKRNKNNKLQVNRVWEDYKLGNIKDKKEVFAKLKEIGGDFNNPVWLENVLNGDNTQVEQKTIDQDLANLDVDVLEGQENAEAEKVFKQSREYVNSEQFKKFFEGSIVTNIDGSPKVMFHGSPATDNINQIWFNSKYIGQGNDQLGSGFYFSSEPMEASAYSESYKVDGVLNDRIKRRIGDTKFSPGIVPVYLSVKNPMPDLFSTTKEQVKKLILSSPLAQSKDEYVNPFVDWFAEFGDLIKQKNGLDFMADQVADSYSDFTDNGTNMVQTKRTLQLIMNDFYEGGEFAPNMLKAIQDIYGYDGYILKENIGDRIKSTVVAHFPEQIQSALQTDIPINNTPVKKSINMEYPYNENKRDNLLVNILNSIEDLPLDKKLSYGEWIRHFVEYTNLDITKARWLGITEKLKKKKHSPKEAWDIVAETQINTIDMHPNSNSKMLILSKQYNGKKIASEFKEAFTDTTLDVYVNVDKVDRTLLVFGAKNISNKIDPVTIHKKLIKYATMNNMDVIVSPDAKSLNQIKTTFDYKAPITSKKFKTEDGKEVTYYSMHITPILKNLSISETNIMQSRSFLSRKDMLNARWLFQDSLLYLKRLQDDIEVKTGKTIKDYNNAYVLENLSKGKILNSFERFDLKYGSKLKDIVQEIILNKNIEIQDVNDYVYAKHAIERNKMKPSGMSNEEANTIINSFEKIIPKKQIDNLIETVKEINRFNVQTAFDNGLITSERFNTIYPRKGKSKTAMFDFYVPLRGFEESETDTSVFIDLNKKMKGRKSKADSPLAYLVGLVQTTMIRAEQNKYKLALYNLLLENPDSNSYEIQNLFYKELDGKIIEDNTKGDKGKLKISEKDLRLGKEIQRFQMGNDSRENTISVMVEGQRKVIEFFGEDNVKIAQGINGYIVEGSKTKGVSDSFKKIGDLGIPANKFFPGIALRDINGFMRNMFTQYSPEFIPVNFVRDMGSGLINITTDYGKDTAIEVAKETTKSIKTLSGYFYGNKKKLPKGDEGEYLAQFIENGTRTGYSQPRSIDEIKKDFADLKTYLDPTNKSIKAQIVKRGKKGYEYGKAVVNILDQSNLVLENTVRYSAFKTLLKKGESVDTASKYAKDLTVNFNKKGMLTNDIAGVFLFFNAGVQGVERMTRPFFTGKAKNATSTYAKVATVGFLSAMLARILGGEDEDKKYFYDKLPEYIRSTNMVLVNPLYLAGVSDTKFLLIPLAYGYSSVFSSSDPFVRYNLGYQGFTSAFSSILDNFAGSFSPLGSVNTENRTPLQSAIKYFTPTGLSPVVDLAQNRNFFGGRIYPDNPYDKSDKPGFRSADLNTNDGATFFSKALNKLSFGDDFEAGYISPKPQQIEYFISQYFGGVGKTVMKTYKLIDNASTPGKPLYEDMNDIPLVRRFATEAEKTSDEYSTYYGMLNAISEAQAKKRSFTKDLENRIMTRKVFNEKMNKKQDDAFGYTRKELVKLGDSRRYGSKKGSIPYNIRELYTEREEALKNKKYELAQKKEQDILKQMKKIQ